MSFKGKCALVTGAASGIGKATAIILAQKGAKVVIVDTDTQKLENVKNEIEAMGGDVLAYTCDVSNKQRVNEITSDALNKFKKIDILINNAAIFRDMGSFLEIPDEMWENYMNVNIMGIVYFTKALLPQMIESGYGRIVNVASVAGVYGNPNMVHYSATKGAVIAMTKALAREFADKGILINSVSPGSVSPSPEDGDMDFVIREGFSLEASYLKRSGSHRENANLICFLASDDASYISGQNIQIDGLRKKL